MVNVENIGFTQVVGCYDSVILSIGEQWWLCYVTKEIICFFTTALVSSPLLKRNAIRGRLCRGFNSVICLEKLNLFKVQQVRIDTITCLWVCFDDHLTC